MSDKESLESKINASINTINRTRLNRINFSERLKKYANRWNIIIFILNIEAVFLIIWTLYADADTASTNMALSSAFFAIYVILLQYFINEQSYSERSLKTHYHQLELRDLMIQLEINKLKLLDLQKDDTSIDNIVKSSTYKAVLNQYEIIMNSYQLALKNNENHANRDDLETKKKLDMKGNVHYDFSFENIFIFINFVVSI